MHFPLLASLITTLSLISVACAAPVRVYRLRCFHRTHDICSTSAHARRGQYILNLNQDSPVASIGEPMLHIAQTLDITPPLAALRQFFWEDTVLGSLGYSLPCKTLPTITLHPLLPTYLETMKSRLEQKLPVYARLFTNSRYRDTGCHTAESSCLAIIRKSSAGSLHGAIIETKSGKHIAQVGDLGDLDPAIVSLLKPKTDPNAHPDTLDHAIVSFLNPQPKTDPNAHPDTIAKADIIAKHMVEWFLTDESVWKKLGFAALPKIIHKNSLPTDSTEYHFTLYGGTKCLEPCSGLVNLVITEGQPINMYHGVVYEHGSQHPLAQLIHAIEGGEKLETPAKIPARSIDSPPLF